VTDKGAGAGSFRFILSHGEAAGDLDALGIDDDDVTSLAQGAYIGLYALPVPYQDAVHFANEQHRRADGQALHCLSVMASSIGTTAYAGVSDDKFHVVLGAEHVARIAFLCDRLTPAIRKTQDESIALGKDFGLQQVLRRFRIPTWEEANEAARNFPDTFSNGNPFGGYMVFHDAIRLIWVHEWAHVLLGHAAVWDVFGPAGAFAEHSDARNSVFDDKLAGVPWAFALQSFELQADQFAARFLAQQILRGYDPASEMAGPSVDLVQRLAVLAAACGLLAIDTFLVDGERPAQNSSHPSAMLRYMTMLHTIEETTMELAPEVTPWVRVASFNLIRDLCELCGDFYPLMSVTPMIAKTPLYKDLCNVQDYLMVDVGQQLWSLRSPFVYFPRGELPDSMR
jgi:hypothetical protein